MDPISFLLEGPIVWFLIGLVAFVGIFLTPAKFRQASTLLFMLQMMILWIGLFLGDTVWLPQPLLLVARFFDHWLWSIIWGFIASVIGFLATFRATGFHSAILNRKTRHIPYLLITLTVSFFIALMIAH